MIRIVGEALSRQGDGRPLSGPSGARLARLCGVSTVSLRELFELRNLCHAYHWIPSAAELEAGRLVLSMRAGDIAVLLGRKVESQFSRYRQEFFTEWDVGACSGKFITSPHPSGLSHWWNNPNNQTRAELFWKDLTDLAYQIRR